MATGFNYIKLNYRFIATFKDGKWDEGKLTKDNVLHINESSPALHYGQQCFEGLKAYRTPSGEINLFRPDLNAKRMMESCDALLMPRVPEELFIRACKEVVSSNKEDVPAHGDGSTMYLRPLVIGVGENLGVKPAQEYIFLVFGSPVGAYFANGFKPVSFCTTNYDRAATYGTGQVKVGGNYAASLKPHYEAVEKGFADCIYLDPETHTKIDEVGAANFFGITKNKELIIPTSTSTLNSITKRSICELSEKEFGLKVIERDVFVDELDEFVECGACGTAAVITPIKAIEHQGKTFTFCTGETAGETITKIYNKLYNIQFGLDSAFPQWIVKIDQKDS